jgi:hypothetical protein
MTAFGHKPGLPTRLLFDRFRGAKQTTLESKPERGTGGDALRPVPRVPPRPRRGVTQSGRRARGMVSLHLRTLAREGA